MSAFENNVSEKIDSLDKNYQNLNVKLEKIEKEKEKQSRQENKND